MTDDLPENQVVVPGEPRQVQGPVIVSYDPDGRGERQLLVAKGMRIVPMHRLPGPRSSGEG